MRISSLISTASVAVAITTATLVVGARTAEPVLVLSATPAPVETNPEAAQSQPGQGASATGSEPVQDQTSQGQAGASATDPSASPAQEPTQTQAPSEPTAAPAAPQSVTQISDEISYKYGVVQVSITKTGDQITDVTLLKGDATYGRDVAYQTLIQATLQYQGTNYGNVSGATFTTEAFKLAVENALAKP